MALNFREMPTGGKRKKGDRVMRKTLPMNLQLFAEGGDGNGDQNAGGDKFTSHYVSINSVIIKASLFLNSEALFCLPFKSANRLLILYALNMPEA